MSVAAPRRDFGLLFAVMLTIAAGNTALQSVMPAIGRLLAVPDAVMALTFSFSALLYALSAPFWARRLDRVGRRRMILTGMAGFTASGVLGGLALLAGIHGWLAPLPAIVGFIAGRLIYGVFGAAAPPAAQAAVAASTGRAERTNALTLLASAFGLGTILGPALAPFAVFGFLGLSGPAFLVALVGAGVTIAAARLLVDDRRGAGGRLLPVSEPSIGGEPGDAAAVVALNRQRDGRLALRDPRVLPWMVSGIIGGHAQAIAGQVMGFLVLDRLALPPAQAQPMIGLVLMAGAASALLAQWGLIPRLKLAPRAMLLWGSLIAAAGCVGVAYAHDIHRLTLAFALASLGFGLVRPGVAAGASLAVGSREQALVAGRVAAVNGAVFVLGPSLGIALYHVDQRLPYLLAAAALVTSAAYLRGALAGRPA